MKYLKYNDKVSANTEYFDGENWRKSPSWMIGQFVSKRSAKKRLFRK